MIGPHTVTVVHPPARDGRTGDPTGSETTETVAGCFWQPRSTSESLDQRDTVTAGAFCSMPATATVAPTDLIEFETVRYSIDGQPALHHTPAGPHHYELQLDRVEGA